ncbi:hypothetical protein P3X46_034689, partial [Hevea brasiliensis]
YGQAVPPVASLIPSKRTRTLRCFLSDQDQGKNQEFQEAVPRGIRKSHFEILHKKTVLKCSDMEDSVHKVTNSSHYDVGSSGNKGESKDMIEVLKVSKSSNMQSMDAVVQKKYPIYLKDIARGEENIQIPLVNEYESLELPNFLYIKSNMVHKDAHVDFSLARISDGNFCAECYGDCLSSDLPCACAAETLGEFAYTKEGLLKENFLDECIAMNLEPKTKHFYYCEVCPLQNDLHQKLKKTKRCKGHLTRKFIKECWSKCGCSRKCKNRVVQQGIQVPLQVYGTPEGKGWGIRSVNALKKGTFVCEYVGEIVTNQELYERNKERAAKQEKHTYPVLLDADWGSERILKDEEALCLDATEFGNAGRFINHSFTKKSRSMIYMTHDIHLCFTEYGHAYS